jgi:hypothetical protein
MAAQSSDHDDRIVAAATTATSVSGIAGGAGTDRSRIISNGTDPR